MKQFKILAILSLSVIWNNLYIYLLKDFDYMLTMSAIVN